MSAPDVNPLDDVDRLIHEPARLKLMAILYVLDSADFTFLMGQTGMTWGNLSTHMSKLEKVNYIEVVKTFKGKRPNTMLRLTDTGKEAFNAYRQQMQQLFDDLPG